MTKIVSLNLGNFNKPVKHKKIKLTKEYIESKQTIRGGYSKAQLAEWGVNWPPPKGWKRALIEGYKPKKVKKYSKEEIEAITDYYGQVELIRDIMHE